MRARKNLPTGERRVNGDLWPQRDHVCFRVAYDLMGAEIAVRRCKKLDVVVQAGGNVGVWPRYLRTAFKTVYTFEPSLENFTLMQLNLWGLDGIRMFNAALSDKDGVCGIKLNPKNCGDDQTIPGEGVETIRLDTFGIDPDLIYLDIQGDEYRALQGARETLERCSPIVAIEVDNKLSRLKGDAVALLGELGYTQFTKYKQDYLFERV